MQRYCYNRRMVRPNILVMIAHDLGWQYGPYGFAPNQSPNLLQLAEDGLTLLQTRAESDHRVEGRPREAAPRR